MENRVESLLLMARAEASQLCEDRDGAYRLLREALSLCPAIAVERLFQFYLGDEEWALAQSLLDQVGEAADPGMLKVLRAVLLAQVEGRAPSPMLVEELRPADGATWAWLYLGLLQRAQGQREAPRQSLLKFVDRTAWRKEPGRQLAARLLLETEKRRCRVCRVRKPADYLQEAIPVCRSCAKMLESPLLEAMAMWSLKRSSQKESKQNQSPFVPLLSRAQIVSVLDPQAKVVWERARQIADQLGRPVMGSGELGMALFEGPFDGRSLVSARHHQGLYHQAMALPEETSASGDLVSDGLAWLLNVAHWQRRLFRGSQQFEDHRQKALDPRLLVQAYLVCQPGPGSLMGGSLAMVTGFNLGDAQAELFEYLLSKDPDNFYLLVVLSSHHRRMWKRDSRALTYELRLIRHFPSAARSLDRWLSHPPLEQRACLDAWVEVVLDNPENGDVLRQAAEFFKWEYPALGLALIERCGSLDPDRNDLAEALHCLERLMERSRGPAESAALAKQCVLYLEPGVAHPPAGHSRLWVWSRIALYAFQAGQFEQARLAAGKLLAKAKDGDPESASTLHVAHSFLGLLAVRDGQMDAAEQHLLASVGCPPGDGHYEPMWKLAHLLWALGRVQAVGEYVRMCGPESLSSKADRLADIKSRWPDFALWLEGQKER